MCNPDAEKIEALNKMIRARNAILLAQINLKTKKQKNKNSVFYSILGMCNNCYFCAWFFLPLLKLILRSGTMNLERFFLLVHLVFIWWFIFSLQITVGCLAKWLCALACVSESHFAKHLLYAAFVVL